MHIYPCHLNANMSKAVINSHVFSHQRDGQKFYWGMFRDRSRSTNCPCHVIWMTTQSWALTHRADSFRLEENLLHSLYKNKCELFAETIFRLFAYLCSTGPAQQWAFLIFAETIFRVFAQLFSTGSAQQRANPSACARLRGEGERPPPNGHQRQGIFLTGVPINVPWKHWTFSCDASRNKSNIVI